MKEKEHHPLSPTVIISGIVITVVGGLIVAFLVGEGRFADATPNQPQGVTSAPVTQVVVVVSATPPAVLLTETQRPVAPTNIPPPAPSTNTQAPQSPIRVAEVPIASDTTKSFSEDLSDTDIIVGEGWMFNNETNGNRGCIAFLMKGPKHYDFVITAGHWYKYANVTSANQAESLLNERITYLVNYANAGCTADNVLEIRLP